MRIAAFNVENLFNRIKAFNDDDPAAHKLVLDAFNELNQLFERPHYSDADKSRILQLMKALGILNRDEGEFVWLRKIRGKLVVRPRSGPVRVAADGRGDWVGWCELKTARVTEEAITMTARVIRDMDADILAIIEVDNRPVLCEFHDYIYQPIAAAGYRHMMVIDGNDDRGIDVGLLAKDGFSLPSMRSHVDETFAGGKRVFSRDCPEYLVQTPGGHRIAVLPNHFKSKYGGNDAASRQKREAQASFTASYYNRLLEEGVDNIVVLGDLNDTPDSDELKPLLETSLKEVTDHPSFTDFEFNASTGDRGIGTFATGADKYKIDFLLLSPALWGRVRKGGIFRKGCWTASNRWGMYPELTKPLFAASDHHGIWVDLDID